MNSASKKKAEQPKLSFWENPSYSGFGIVIGLLIVGGMALLITSFIDNGGSSDKCWNYGGRSDDTYNC